MKSTRGVEINPRYANARIIATNSFLPTWMLVPSFVFFFPLFFGRSPLFPTTGHRGSSIARQFCISTTDGYYLSVDTEKLVFPGSH